MGKAYAHLSLSERDQITLLLAEGKSLREIARALGRSPSTISWELGRNASPDYRLDLFHGAQGRVTQRRQPQLKTPAIAGYVHSKLALGWSPEQIAGRLRLDQPGWAISYEAIYQYIYHPRTATRLELIGCLRRAHRHRKPRNLGRRERKTKIPAYPSRRRLRRAANSATGRLSPGLSPEPGGAQLARGTHQPAGAQDRAGHPGGGGRPARLRPSPAHSHSRENAAHGAISAAITVKCLFAQPYASWERGSCENTNGLVRWYLPKGTHCSTISETELARIESLLNNRPRKCLGFRTPLEVATPYVALRD